MTSRNQMIRAFRNCIFLTLDLYNRELSNPTWLSVSAWPSFFDDANVTHCNWADIT